MGLQAIQATLSFYHSSFSVEGLNVALLTGSTRVKGPPTVLHPRVTQNLVYSLEGRGHEVVHIDPTEFQLLDKPHFGYAHGKAPEKLEAAQTVLKNADAYVCVTPEYNHSPSPALLNILNHFGSSTFSFKPSAIVTYSAGQWGGTRAGVSLRTTLSELGCLPVSAMIHLPKAQQVFDRDGKVNVSAGEDPDQWEKYFARTWFQLEWWAEAAKRHKSIVDPFGESPAFASSPDERNAP